jgi:FHA domain-containing protein
MERMMRTPMDRLDDESPRARRSTGAWLIRKELPVGRPKPPARPPTPGGINTPGGSTGGGMICPGTDRTRGAAAAGGAGAVDETALESPAQRVLRKPSALGGKSIYLTVIEGDLKGKSFDITGIGTYTIGRQECDIVLDDEKVSRKHASVVIIREGQYAVQDLASRNGTFVNGVRLTRRNVQHNDLIRVGNTTLRFTVFDGPVPVQA